MNPLSAHLILLLSLASAALMACGPSQEPPPAQTMRPQSLESSSAEELEEAIFLYRRASLEKLVFATDENERFDGLYDLETITGLANDEYFDFLFNLADEAFEAERDTATGIGQGPARGPLPAIPSRLHQGELGGLDSASCRACHFAGGADGAGTMTQQGYFRGDGQTLSSVTVRDAPHVMGLGYITRLGQNMTADLHLQRDFLLSDTIDFGQEQEVELTSQGLSFGILRATLDGEGGATLDTSEVQHVSPDLVIRPLGHKGRFSSLVALADEALQIHHGHQSTSRLETHRDEAATFLGPGPLNDPDEDGITEEISSGQSLLLGIYMSMLSTPQMRPPSDPLLIEAWGKGWDKFQQVGCTECHRSELLMPDYDLTLQGQGDRFAEVVLDLEEVGLEPKPRNLDFSPDDNGSIPVGIPVFAFTDLRRHDMGEALADPYDEALPLSPDVIPGNVWLTRSLWGLADTGPYLHDGRAPTVHDAIKWHGGEALSSRDAYLALSEEDQGALRLFLMSLTRPAGVLVE